MKGSIGLAHTRLSIIDRAHGSQPMFSADGRYGVVFNGEIYNHREIRSNLARQGYPFVTHCDTEVLLALYETEGTKMVSSLRGMFAFAIVDTLRDEVFLARDRFGKKPLYFSIEPRGSRSPQPSIHSFALRIGRHASMRKRSLSTWSSSTCHRAARPGPASRSLSRDRG